MKITVKYFASIREAVGVASEARETRSTTLGELRAELVSQGGGHAHCLAPGRPVRMALNQFMCDESVSITEGAEVAFFPPVTGG